MASSRARLNNAIEEVRSVLYRVFIQSYFLPMALTFLAILFRLHAIECRVLVDLKALHTQLNVILVARGLHANGLNNSIGSQHKQDEKIVTIAPFSIHGGDDDLGGNDFT